MNPLLFLKKIKWSMRKVSFHSNLSGLVLDVGSGNNPHPAADVLTEKYIDTSHRFEALVVDRPLVLADACKLPFRDKAFDFVMAYHVLEHMHEPGAFLREIERVGKSGYIEAPNALYERLCPYPMHILEVLQDDGQLIIHKKRAPVSDEFLAMAGVQRTDTKLHKFFFENPELFHVQYYWEDSIRYKVLNPDVDTSWYKDPELLPTSDITRILSKRKIGGARDFGLYMLRHFFRLLKPKPKMESIIVCPDCHGALTTTKDLYLCPLCNVKYNRSPFPDFTARVK